MHKLSIVPVWVDNQNEIQGFTYTILALGFYLIFDCPRAVLNKENIWCPGTMMTKNDKTGLLYLHAEAISMIYEGKLQEFMVSNSHYCCKKVHYCLNC